ncbi:FAD-dependent monooxygenase [Thalassotalea sp. HSM 43]|uniref:FAD-dependent oxidoreductase n=1 Tax=Thalassotalea sp. HSM 43 TaxID=2552945 RepID=UPI00107FD80F|nr:NAD(P)/FAD-dependent oxidoreductase [Thalassotalea sp. HSM 43]QBY04905.1 FAD-dependent monooxygenase [Thalassotalea sp. HSM 43]
MSNSQKQRIAIAGAGPVGSLLAVMLAKKGYPIDLFESRPDSRQTNIYQGKSINLALSDRGWLALQSIGLDTEIREHAIPMYCRVMHDKQGNLTTFPYGKDNQAIWSVSRSGINEQLINIAEQQDNVKVHFEHRLAELDFDSLHSTFSCQDGDAEFDSDLMIGADGAFSKVRRLAQELQGQRISHSLEYMPQSYMELSISANADGSHKMEKNALHIWPRGEFMLIALPNPDGSFTCTLFLDHEGELSFESLDNAQKVQAFFADNFADALDLLDDPVNDFLAKRPSSLCLVHIYPWVFNNKVALIGDAAHAMVPFYGQGMNCGFEDCRVMDELESQYNGDWQQILPAYQAARKANGDAIIELAKRNFIEMSELSGDANFLLRKKIEAKFNERYPELWVPLYSMVTFSPHIPYEYALRTGDIQKQIMDEIMQIPNIAECWQEAHVYDRLHSLAVAKLEAA